MTAQIPIVIGLGCLVDFIIRDARGKRIRVNPADERWLAWKPDTRDLVVLRPGQGQDTHVERNAALRHERFHGASPKNAQVMQWPKPFGKEQALGLIESVTYCATGIQSPIKKAHHWIHQFGDRGERRHGSTESQYANRFNDRLFPRLESDHVGNLFVVRRSGNRYLVRDWIIG